MTDSHSDTLPFVVIGPVSQTTGFLYRCTKSLPKLTYTKGNCNSQSSQAERLEFSDRVILFDDDTSQVKTLCKCRHYFIWLNGDVQPILSDG